MSNFEVFGLHEVAFDLGIASTTAVVKARQVVQKSSDNVKRAAQQSSAGLSHAPLYPLSITYETAVKAGGIEGLIGPDKDRPQGALGNLIEFGSAKNPPHADLAKALDHEGPGFEKAMAEVVDL